MTLLKSYGEDGSKLLVVGVGPEPRRSAYSCTASRPWWGIVWMGSIFSSDCRALTYRDALKALHEQRPFTLCL
jgi:hypothetical protein